MPLLVSKMMPKFFQLGVEEKSRHRPIVRFACRKLCFSPGFLTIVTSVDV